MKVVRKHRDGYLLESYNSSYPPRFVSSKEVVAIHRVVYVRMLK